MPGVFCTREVTEGLDGGPQAVAGRLKELMPGSEIYCLKQMHSDRIVRADDISHEDFPEADGIISRDPGKVLCIRTADCVSVLLWAEDSPLIGAVHAGWRGLSLRIVEKAIGIMRAGGAGHICVSMGPAIGPCCYAVGPEVIEALEADADHTLDGRLSVDLHRIAALQAQNAGVPPGRIHQVKSCTCCKADLFFSYRREGVFTGRNISLIGGESWSLPGLQAR
jgi:purine-nucleoside/S-methyl-5'-thioadenosine phosphorylase / adenosine deaminase